MQLNKHLVAQTRPKAKQENMIFWKQYRVTVLGERLFRLERSENERFRDEATQTVWFRDMDKQAFSFTEMDGSAVIQTRACRLELREERSACTISIDGGQAIPIGNDGNLLGTYRTLDRCDGDTLYFYSGELEGRVELGKGVCSKTGVATFDDAPSLTLDEDGMIKSQRGDGTDEYIFAFGNDYRGAVKALYALTGNTPLVPRFALGNWWSRYYAYTQEGYMEVLQRFEDQNVPLSVATIDMDWHYNEREVQDFVEKTGRKGVRYGTENCHVNVAWTGYTWSEKLFPDYRGMLQEIGGRGLKITLNLHPADGVRFWETQYEEMARNMGIDPKTGEQVAFDITDPNFINNYFALLHKPYEAEGIHFWWIDWQQGTKTKIDGLDPLWSLNHYHYLDNQLNRSTPLILSRYAGIGSHRYPLGFSGDTQITWKTLDYLPYFTATASNVGYTWWSHDIGGHDLGEKNDELYVRHLQYGVYSPINRLHCTCLDTVCKEPWLYRNGAGEIAKEFLRLRHRLIPYLYTASYATHVKGDALVEPLYYAWDEEKAYEYDREYLFGGQLLVIPVVTPRQADGYARTRAWIPEGEWTDITTGDKYVAPKGGKEYVLLRTLEEYPVLAKAGGILPLSIENGNSVQNPTNMEIGVWSGNGAFTLFEDDREKGGEKEFFTEFTSVKTQANGRTRQTLTITSHGEPTVLPSDRILRIIFKNIRKGGIRVLKNGQETPFKKRYAEVVSLELVFEPFAKYELIVDYIAPTKLEEIKRRATDILTRAQGGNMQKFRLWEAVMRAQSEEEVCEAIEEGELSQGEKERLRETL